MFKNKIKKNKFKLNKFLLCSLMNYTLYLGYSHSQLNVSMAYDLLGQRMNISIHLLNHTLSSIKKLAITCNSIWYNFSTIWVVCPKNFYIRQLLLRYRKEKKLCNSLFFWLSPWLPGFFNNFLGFAKLKNKIKYPAALFYLQSTGNEERLQEATTRGILNFNVVDTNSSSNYGINLINSNETTTKSNLYYSKILLSISSNYKIFYKKTFVFKY